MGKHSSKKRKNRHGQSNQDRKATSSSGVILSPPPLPQLDVPAFRLAINSNGNESDDLKMQNPKKKPKKEKQVVRDAPEFCVSPAKLKRVIRVSDLQELVLWLLADGVASQWLLVKRKQDIRKAVVVMVPGLDMALLDGTVDLTSVDEPVDEDIGEVVRRENGGSNSTAIAQGEPMDDSLAGCDVEEGEVMEKDMPVEEVKWTVVGNKKYPDAKPFSFYPSMLAGRSLAPCLTPLRNIFTHVWPTKTDGDDKYNKIHSPISHFLNCPIDKKAPSNLPKHRSTSRIGITQLLMTPEELYDNEYPMHSSVLRRMRQEQGATEESQDDMKERERLKEEGWVETEVTGMENDTHNEAGSITEGRKIYSIDCEMCITEAGPELTRISVIGWDGNVVYDTLVKPDRPIVDYLTQFSGITKEKLESVATTLSDVQSHLLQLFQPAHRIILVGQSLNSDLKALKFMHPFIVDTSLIYDHSRGKPYKPSLKWLSMKYLKREIQKGQHIDPGTKKMEPGHDSIEDAVACIDLVKLKLEKGLAFGSAEVHTESIFSRLERGYLSQGNRHGLCWSAVVDHGNPAMLYTHAKKTVACQNDKDVVNGIQEALHWQPVPKHSSTADPRAIMAERGEISFVWARLRELEILRGWDNANRQQKQLDESSAIPPMPPTPHDPPAKVLAKKVAETVSRLQSIYKALPLNTAFIVYSGTGDPREMGRLYALQRKFREEYRVRKWDELSVKWTDDEQQALNRAVKRTREGGLSFMTVKVDEEQAEA
ncbi:hypothetical protein EV426DRAFT_341114 [Tirmania nivea]|nr:hypothetical protein EV426DRAFT_341114 [Tirmania nivea]